MTKRIKPRRIFHVHGHPYHEENSRRGIRHAKVWRYKWIDLDVHVTKDGVLVNTHWPRPMAHDGFVDPLGKLPRLAEIEQMTWEEVSRLRTPQGGYRISKAEHNIEFALRVGLNVELEMKSSKITIAQLKELRSKLSYPDRVQVKTLATLQPAPGLRLWRAKRAGFVTIILGRNRPVSRAFEPYIDYRRGRVRWI